MKLILKKISAAILTVTLVVVGCLAMPPQKAEAASFTRTYTITPENYTNYSHAIYESNHSGSEMSYPFQIDGNTITILKTGCNYYTFNIEGDFSDFEFRLASNYTGSTYYCDTYSSYRVDFNVAENAKVGLIYDTLGEVINNGTIVGSCRAKYLNNYGYVGTSYGVDMNNSVSNYGTIGLWNAYAGTNESTGVIQEVVAGSSVYVSNNYGFIDVNNGNVGNGYTEGNHGVIGYNNGSTRNNFSDGRIIYNTSTGSVEANVGIISQNSGDITNSNSGTIYENLASSFTMSPSNNTGTVTAESDPALPELLEMYYPQPAPEPEPEVVVEKTSEQRYMDTLDNLTNDFEEAAKAVSLSGDKKDTVTIYYNVGDALPLDIFRTLKDCEGVYLDYKCEYEGKPFHFLIKGGKDMKIDENVGWYGVYFLTKMYGALAE